MTAASDSRAPAPAAAGVVARLADLRGPASGPVQLPLRLFWSGPTSTFDLDDPGTRQFVYETVLGRARQPEELTGLLHGPSLVAIWPSLFLAPEVRRAWEDRHPVLRAATARAA